MVKKVGQGAIITLSISDRFLAMVKKAWVPQFFYSFSGAVRSLFLFSSIRRAEDLEGYVVENEAGE